MDLNTICFIQFGFLFIGFILLEGFDYGVGMLLPFWGKSDAERQALIDTLAPVWEGNEVWMIAAGAFLFAGFPHAYATMFSGMYLALLLILVALILRGVAFEFRDKKNNKSWRRFWDWSIFAGSLIPALIWGIAIANLIKGLPIDASMEYAGSFWDLMSLFTLTSGIVFSLLFVVHGIAYLSLRLEKSLVEQLEPNGHFFCKYTVLGLTAFMVMAHAATDISDRPLASVIMALPILFTSLISANYRARRYSRAFALSCCAILSLMFSVFGGLYPRIIVSSLDSRWSLDIYNSASNPLTLEVMSTALLLALPIILALEAWKFYIFKTRVALAKLTNDNHDSLRRLLQKLRIQIRNAQCLAGVLRSVSCALRSKDGNVIDRIKYKHKSVLFAGLPRKVFRRSLSRRSPNHD